MKSKGHVYLVGAGPGDPGLLTLRGAELLRRADVVVYDVLVNPSLLALASSTAELISRGGRDDAKSLSQEELIELLIQKARDGKSVVRLKGGDPYVFGRGAEEAEALAAAKIPFEVVPGVSSIVAAPNYAGIPLTHRRYCSSFTVLTGHEDPTAEGFEQTMAEIARIPGTKVVLMGLKKIREWSQALIRNGVAATTPAALIEWGTTGRQKSVSGSLEHLGDLAEKNGLVAPVITVVGDVVNLRSALNWFEHRPLFGQRVVVTRAREQSAGLIQKLAELGADVLEIPTIRIVTPDRRQDIIDALLDLNAYDWLVFTSANGVTSFFDLFFKRFQDLRDIGGVRIAAVGPATAAKLRELHLQVDLMPEEALASKIAAAFKAYESIENLKICLLRAEVANTDLPQALEELGAIVDDIAVYKTVAEIQDSDGAARRLREHGADWILFTSPSTVTHFHERFDLPKLVQKFVSLKLASIGPETTTALSAIGLTPAIEATPHTTDALVAALLKSTKTQA